MPKDFGPIDRAPSLPRKQALNFTAHQFLFCLFFKAVALIMYFFFYAQVA